MMRVLHVISGLGVGGAEMMLYKLLRARARCDDTHAVLCLQRGGDMKERIAALGVTVQSVELDRLADLPRALWALADAARRIPHDLVQGWMYHGNCAASLIGMLSGKPVLWNVRQSLASPSIERRATARIITFSARISRYVDTTIYNSTTSIADHHRLGFSAHRDATIDNGFDLEQFKPDAESRRHLRTALNIAPDALVIGLIGRYHPMKDHAGFLHAAARFTARGIPVHYVLAGTGETLTTRLVVGLAKRSYDQTGVTQSKSHILVL